MVLAQIGPLTTMLEAAAAAFGAGVVVFGVAAGAVGLMLGRSKRSIEERAATGGYIGGGLGALIAMIDVVLRYAFLK